MNCFFCIGNEIVYFHSFGVEHVPGEIKEFVGNKNIIANIFQVQANNSVMCGTSALDSLILWLQVKNWLILLACFILMIFELFQGWMKLIKQT